jgi:hypothetical protein
MVGSRTTNDYQYRFELAIVEIVEQGLILVEELSIRLNPSQKLV